MTDLDLGPVASGYQALKGMLFAPQALNRSSGLSIGWNRSSAIQSCSNKPNIGNQSPGT